MFHLFTSVNPKKIISVALVTLGLAFATHLSAEEQDQQTGNFHVGLKLGKFNIDVSGADDADAKGFQLGYHFGNEFSLDLEYLSGDNTVELGVPFDVDGTTTTTSLYGTYRSEGDGYFLAKLGVLREKVELSSPVTSVSETETGLSYGVGAGYRVTANISFEAEYTIIESDVDYIGGTLRFSL